MSDKKIITIIGSTGAQGGGVVDTFLSDPKLKNEWTVRAVTRDVTKDSAKALQSRGAEVVAADINDKASLVKAFNGAYAVFAVTNYWEKASADHEIQQGKTLADAAKEAGVQHYIWSSLLDVNKLSNGALPNVYHFDSKAKVEEYIRTIGLPATFFLPGFYASNISSGGMFAPFPPDNVWTFSLPVPATAPIPIYDPVDTGKFVKAAISHRGQTLGKRILGATAYVTGQEIVDGFRRVFPEAGAEARYYEAPEAAYRDVMKGKGMPDFIVQELYENMRLLQDFGYYGGESLEWTHSLLDGDVLTAWEDHVRSDRAQGFKELK